MKKIFVTMMAAAALLSCAKETPYYTEGEAHGNLMLNVVSDPVLSAETRANVELSSIGVATPDAMSLRTLVTCLDEDISNFNEAFSSVTIFNEADVIFAPAKYYITIGSTRTGRNTLPNYTGPSEQIANKKAPAYFYANQDVKRVPETEEGENAPYYEGTATVDVTAGQTAIASVTAKLANTIVCIDFTDRFKSYFATGASLTLTTKAGFKATVGYTESNKTVAKKYYFVRPQEFSIAGTATKQSASPGIIEPKPVAIEGFSEKDPQPQTLYTYTFDVSDVNGTGGITITVNDEPIQTIEDEFELNPKA